MLDTQINMYSVDTGHFYSNHEKYLHNMNCKYRQERNYLNNLLEKLGNKLKENGFTEDDISKLKRSKIEDYNQEIDPIIKEFIGWSLLIKHKRDKRSMLKVKQKQKKMQNNFITKEVQRDMTVQVNMAMLQIAQVLKVEVVMYRQKYI